MWIKLYVKRKGKKPLVWIYREGKGDYGFIDILKAGKKQGYYVHITNKGEALDGDEVRFYLRDFKWKEEAVVQSVEKRAERVFVGEIQFTKKTFGFFIPSSSSLKTDVFIWEWHTLWAKHGQKVAVKILSWKGKNPEGQVVEVLWNGDETGLDVISIALEWGARTKFSEDIQKEADKVSKERKEIGIKQRRDLSKLFTFTIDGEDAKDLDDAISIEKFENGNFKLFVHIADVTHYVEEDSFIDREALKRGTSIYLADRVIPMIPEALSNGVCSLNAWEPKLTLTCEMDIAPNGKIIGSKIYESIIESDYRLTYKEVEQIAQYKFRADIDMSDEWNTEPKEKKEEGNIKILLQDNILIKSIQNAYELKKKIESYRIKNGYLQFNFQEAKIIVDAEGKPVDVKLYEKLESNKVIEHFMISANEAVSKKFSWVPFLYRVHPIPDGEDLQKAITTIGSYISLDTTNLTFEWVLSQVSQNNSLSRILLRALPKALYSEKNEGHFWLGLEFYSHFTSPIRRYPDLQIHRIIKQKLSGKLDTNKIAHYKKLLPEVATSNSDSERKAEAIERKVTDLFKMKYMKSRIWEEYKGIISWAIAKGIFIELENTIEWFIPFETIQSKFWGFKKGNYFEFFEESLEFRNKATGMNLRFWDTLKVKVASVDESLLRVEFDLIEKI
jgi:ribonuclease R